MSGGELDLLTMTDQAEVHKFKTEYVDARNIHTQILQEALMNQNPYHQALALFNIAEIDVCIGAPKEIVQKNIDTAKSLFKSIGYLRLMQWCDVVQADLQLREGDMLGAETLFAEGLRATWGKNSDIVAYCLERLADKTRWNLSFGTLNWTVIFLVLSLKSKQKLELHKALQFLGDNFLTQGDEQTAMGLITIALEGFTQMDVHRSKAECLLRLGDIFRHSNLPKAIELWESARPMFERASQAKRLEHIDKKLAGLSIESAGETKE